MNPQVLMMAISPLGIAESCTHLYPANSSWRINRSASTRFFEQPNVIMSISPFLISNSEAALIA
jgi:hypothetical protein